MTAQQHPKAPSRSRLSAVALSALGLALLAPGLTACRATSASDSNPIAAHATVTELQLFAAQSLVDVTPQLIAAYQADHPGVRLVASFGGSGTLATQINQGAPADIFLAADTTSSATITRTLDEVRVVATNRLVLIVPARNPAGITRAADLPGAKVALCATSVPCGRSATTFLSGAGVKLTAPSEETDVRSVLAKVTSGEADAGFVYATDAAAAGDAVTVIRLENPPLNHYQASVLADSQATHRAAAADFVDWLSSPAAQIILRSAGFAAP